MHHPRDADSGSLAWDPRLCIDNKLPGDANIWGQIWNKKLLKFCDLSGEDHSKNREPSLILKLYA